MQIATGAERQLTITQAVVDRITNPQVKLLATTEVEEQTNLRIKLREIAKAKSVTLPTETDADVQILIEQSQKLSGNELDSFYLQECGIKGHELLQKTMQLISKNAKDEALKKLSATLPTNSVHLSTSKDVKDR